MEMIEAICCVYPDGTVFWTDDVQHGAAKAVDAWKSTLSSERRDALDSAGATLGAVMVRMPAEAYRSITVTGTAMELAYADAEKAV